MVIELGKLVTLLDSMEAVLGRVFVDRARACNAGKQVHLLLVQDFIDVCFRAGLVGEA